MPRSRQEMRGTSYREIISRQNGDVYTCTKCHDPMPNGSAMRALTDRHTDKHCHRSGTPGAGEEPQEVKSKNFGHFISMEKHSVNLHKKKMATISTDITFQNKHRGPNVRTLKITYFSAHFISIDLIQILTWHF